MAERQRGPWTEEGPSRKYLPAALAALILAAGGAAWYVLKGEGRRVSPPPASSRFQPDATPNHSESERASLPPSFVEETSGIASPAKPRVAEAKIADSAGGTPPPEPPPWPPETQRLLNDYYRLCDQLVNGVYTTDNLSAFSPTLIDHMHMATIAFRASAEKNGAPWQKISKAFRGERCSMTDSIQGTHAYLKAVLESKRLSRVQKLFILARYSSGSPYSLPLASDPDIFRPAVDMLGIARIESTQSSSYERMELQIPSDILTGAHSEEAAEFRRMTHDMVDRLLRANLSDSNPESGFLLDALHQIAVALGYKHGKDGASSGFPEGAIDVQSIFGCPPEKIYSLIEAFHRKEDRQ